MHPFQPPPWRSPSPFVHGVAAVAASFAAIGAVGAIYALSSHYAVRTELAAVPAAQVHGIASLPCPSALPPALAARSS
jgi:hypothetical protein